MESANSPDHSEYENWNLGIGWCVLGLLGACFMARSLLVGQAGVSTKHSSCLWKPGDMMTLNAYISDSAHVNKSNLVWKEDDMVFGSFEDDQVRETQFSVPATEALLSNGSLFLDAFLRRKSSDSNPQLNVVSFRYPLVHSTGGSFQFYPNISLQIVADNSSIPIERPFPGNLRVYSQNKAYFHLPLFHVNDGWNLRENHVKLRPDRDMEFFISVRPVGMWRYQWEQQFFQALKHQETAYQIDTEEIKRVLLQTNPILLAATILVSTIHMVLDIFAFKNDIQFWNSRTSLEGLSTKTLVLNAGSQLIILLYLLDTETNWMVVMSIAFGLAVELWKLARVFGLERTGTFPWIKIRHIRMPSNTEAFDNMAFRYLSWGMVPLLMAYTAYSWHAESFTGWYSFLLKTLVGFVYAFGFIMMTPQLFINYKLKSVAHMPWRSFMYKAINTFIDDLFAFIIKMPLLHRLACLRDDVVFVIYLYQLYLYPIDKTRMNEFGQVEHPKTD